MGSVAENKRKTPHLPPSCARAFAFLDRNASRDAALAWKDAVYQTGTARILSCELRDLKQSWDYFRRADLHKSPAFDATSFSIMKRERITLAYTFDYHFAVAGFRLIG